MNIKMPPRALSGQFRMVVSEDAAMERVKHDTGFFDNLITDVGMNRVGETSFGQNQSIQNFRLICGRFVVGSGSAAPQFTDTALQNPVAFATSDVLLDNESSSYERGWYEITVRYQFGQGEAAGNLSEIGIQHSGLSGPLWSRALILDGAGNPTTITVLSDDFLTCYYTLRVMIPQTDAVFNINVDYDVDGIVPTVVTARPLHTESTNTRSAWGFKAAAESSRGNLTFYDGGLAIPTATRPLGNSAGLVSQFSIVPYVAGSYQRFVLFELGLNESNSQELRTADLGALMGRWQIEFDPPLQKDDTQTMQLTFGYSWARA